MLILYVSMKYDYGKPEQGYSFEHYNFFDSLRRMGHDLIYFDFYALAGKHGGEKMNRMLREVVRSEKPDLTFTVLFGDELNPVTIREISDSGETQTLNWFCDDHWRFEDFSKRWAPCFNWVVTTAGDAVRKYAEMGYPNVIKSQWACNHRLYQKLDLPLKYDVTFVGQSYSHRRPIIDAIRAAGISIAVWGSGWESGRLGQEDMIRVFNQSRINLNLSEAVWYTQTTADAARGRVWRTVGALPFGRTIQKVVKRTVKGSAKPTSPKLADVNYDRFPKQIKGRNFEIPGCGGFTLTGEADNIEDYYKKDREIACYSTVTQIVERLRYFLDCEGERAAIANAGWRRTLLDHTYERRFHDIFQRLGLETLLSAPIASPALGQVTEID